MRTYAIGDIHGHVDLLKQAHARIAQDRSRTGDQVAPVVHVGDLVDRGPDSNGVISLLLEECNSGAPFVVLLGNHDRMMRRFLHPDCLPDELRRDLDWLKPSLGGRNTLASYGVDVSDGRSVSRIHRDARSRVPQAHLDFLDRLSATYVRGDIFLPCRHPARNPV